jgi:RNA polymerase sigma factor (sigma-70 family)
VTTAGVSSVGSRARVEELFRRDYARLVRAAWMLSGSREVAEDVVQEVFAQLISSTDLHGVEDASGYVYRAVVNRVRSWQRWQSLERRYSVDERDLVPAAPDVSGFAEFLAVLSARQRMAVVLRYYCDLPLAQVADLMGCRRGTVSVLLRRALAKARTMKEVFEP